MGARFATRYIKNDIAAEKHRPIPLMFLQFWTVLRDPAQARAGIPDNTTRQESKETCAKEQSS